LVFVGCDYQRVKVIDGSARHEHGNAVLKRVRLGASPQKSSVQKNHDRRRACLPDSIITLNSHHSTQQLLAFSTYHTYHKTRKSGRIWLASKPAVAAPPVPEVSHPPLHCGCGLIALRRLPPTPFLRHIVKLTLSAVVWLLPG
jgi:hypothetical protein